MILALCGTTEGRELVKRLSEKNIPLIATVTTEYGSKLLQENMDIEILTEKLDKNRMKELIAKRNVKEILDITHPYAENISKLALEVSKEANIDYYRYERQDTIYTGDSDEDIIWADDFYHAAKIASEIDGKIFLTIGSNQIPIFLEKIKADRLIARVLPLSNIVKLCEQRGFTPDNLIAMKGPFNKEMNIQMFRNYNASVIVAKDSGKTGGTDEKIQAARDLNLPVILVKKPTIEYENLYKNMNLLVDKIASLY